MISGFSVKWEVFYFVPLFVFSLITNEKDIPAYVYSCYYVSGNANSVVSWTFSKQEMGQKCEVTSKKNKCTVLLYQHIDFDI